MVVLFTINFSVWLGSLFSSVKFWIILAGEGWCYQGDILESGARHSRYSPLPLAASREEVTRDSESRVIEQKRRWYARGYQRVYAQMFVNGNVAFHTSDGLLGTYQKLFFVFCYVYGSVSLNPWTGWLVFYIKIQSVPRSKHSPSQLYKPVS